MRSGLHILDNCYIERHLTYAPKNNLSVTLRKLSRARASKTLKCSQDHPNSVHSLLKSAKGGLVCEYCWAYRVMRLEMSSRKGSTYKEEVKYDGWSVMSPRLAEGPAEVDMVAESSSVQAPAATRSRAK